MDPVSKAQFGAGNSEKSGKRKVFGRPFQKGQSGNPLGRPKKKPVTAMFEELFDDGTARAEIKKRMRKTLTEKGMAGVLLLREGAERVEGKVADVVNVSGELRISLEEVLEAKKKANK